MRLLLLAEAHANVTRVPEPHLGKVPVEQIFAVPLAPHPTLDRGGGTVVGRGRKQIFRHPDVSIVGQVDAIAQRGSVGARVRQQAVPRQVLGVPLGRGGELRVEMEVTQTVAPAFGIGAQPQLFNGRVVRKKTLVVIVAGVVFFEGGGWGTGLSSSSSE